MWKSFMLPTWRTCSSEPLTFARSLAIWAALTASLEASVASRIFVGNVFISSVLSFVALEAILPVVLPVVPLLARWLPAVASLSARPLRGLSARRLSARFGPKGPRFQLALPLDSYRAAHDERE